MFTIDRIEDNIVVLENRLDSKLMNVDISMFPREIKEGDIVDLIDNKYVINEEETKKVRNKIRDRFNRLKK